MNSSRKWRDLAGSNYGESNIVVDESVVCFYQRGDNPLHVAVRGRSKRITDFLLRNPKNARLLYTKNRTGETPYQIDAMHDKSILSQVFAARKYIRWCSCELSDIIVQLF